MDFQKILDSRVTTLVLVTTWMPKTATSATSTRVVRRLSRIFWKSISYDLLKKPWCGPGRPCRRPASRG